MIVLIQCSFSKVNWLHVNMNLISVNIRLQLNEFPYGGNTYDSDQCQ